MENPGDRIARGGLAGVYLRFSMGLRLRDLDWLEGGGYQMKKGMRGEVIEVRRGGVGPRIW